jgi:hypothetical protein
MGLGTSRETFGGFGVTQNQEAAGSQFPDGTATAPLPQIVEPPADNPV